MEYTMSPVSELPVTAEKSMVRYAGFWRRFWAALIDGLLLGVVFTAVSMVFGVGIWGARTTYDTSATNTSIMNNATAASTMMGGIMLLVLIEVAGSWLYFALMESSKNQATLGKMALGLRVTDLNGHRISFGKATGRYFAKILSAMTLMIGYIMAGFTAKKQALHDFVAGTLVLSKQSGVSAQVAENAFAAS